MLPEGIQGSCEGPFNRVADVLARQLASGQHGGAAVAVHHRGRPVVDVWAGRRTDGTAWAPDTMAISFSTTKGPAAVALHMALERHGVDYDSPVSSVWPEFGKDAVTIRHCLCHEAGIPQIRGEVPDVWAMADWDGMVALMERLEPLWEPGTANGYHALNFGWLVGELVRRIDGRDIRTFIADEIAGPLGLDGFSIGTPEAERGRLAPLHMATDATELQSLIPPDSITARALSPEGDIVEFVNSPAGQGCCGPAFTGAFTARSLARFYACLERGGELDGVRLLKRETVEAASTVQNRRPDLVLIVPIHWRLGFMSGGSAVSPAGPNYAAFGHAGYGGSVGMADPSAELSFALVLDTLEPNLLGDERGRDLIVAALAAAEEA